MSHPLISIIILNWENKQILQECVNSILSQTFQDYEILMADSINNSIKQVAGKYLVFLDNCDLWEREKLQKQVNILENNPEVGLVYCGENFEGYAFNRLVLRNFLQNSSIAMIRKSCLQDICLDNSTNWELFLKLSLSSKFFGIKSPLAKCRAVGICNGITFETSGFKELNKIFQLKELTAKQLRLINLAYAMRYFQTGKKYFKNKLFNRAKGFFREALKRDFSVCFRSDIILFYLLSLFAYGKDVKQRKIQLQ